MACSQIVDGSNTVNPQGSRPTGGSDSPRGRPPDAVPAPAETITGTITTSARTTLSSSAVAIAALIKQETGTLVNRQVQPISGDGPISFSIGFDPSVIDPSATYVVKGGIVDGPTVWENRQGVAAITAGTPATSLTLPVTQAPAPIPAPTPAPTAPPSGSAAPSGSQTAKPSTPPKPSTTPKPSATPKPARAGPTPTPTLRPPHARADADADAEPGSHATPTPTPTRRPHRPRPRPPPARPRRPPSARYADRHTGDRRHRRHADYAEPHTLGPPPWRSSSLFENGSSGRLDRRDG